MGDRSKAANTGKIPDLAEPIALLGYGVEGKSTLRHLLRWGFRKVEVLDQKAPKDALPEGVKGLFGPDYLAGLKGAATAIRSPGLRPLLPEVREFAKAGFLTSQVELAFSLLGPKRLIGVTGTLGKGTCCSLLSVMLEKAGIGHKLAGNIGLAPLDALENLDDGDMLLLELSSFQLSTLRQSPGAAVVLRTTSEHLDWHASQAEYWDHKANMVRNQKAGDFCVFFADAPGSAYIGALGSGQKISVGEKAMVRIGPDAVEWPERNFRLALSETRLTGAFNLENLGAAAAAALELGAPLESVRAAAREFSPLEHRLEFVRKAGGVSYYNDSYATRPEAALAAVRALRGNALGLILGGSEKFADFGELALGLKPESHLKAVAFIGQTAERMKSELEAAGALQGKNFRICPGLSEAMDFLRAEIREGAILLSPACASFGLFSDYKERGKVFKSLTRNVPDLG